LKSLCDPKYCHSEQREESAVASKQRIETDSSSLALLGMT
jgi:hypothetical protein